MKEYSWWGFGENEPPEHLKTKKQLSQIGKRPGNTVGVIRTPEYDCYLYDPDACPDKRPLTEKQKAYLERRRQEKEQAELERQKLQATVHLESAVIRWIPTYLESLLVEFSEEDNPFRELWVKNRCSRITQACKVAKEALRFLYPLPEPEPDSAVLGSKHACNVPLDSDGQCRAVVRGGMQCR